MNVDPVGKNTDQLVVIMVSPFHVVLYVFIGILVLLCFATMVMYIYDACNAVSDNYTDLESNGVVEQHQASPTPDKNFIVEEVDGVNDSQTAFGYEHDHLLMEKTVSSNLECPVAIDSNTNSHNKNAHSIYRKPMQLAMIDSQFSSKRKAAAPPAYSKIVSSSPARKTQRNMKNAASLKRKAPSAPMRL